MARNWGGEGIEKQFSPGESLVLRFGNFYLTNRRLGHYRTMNSTFEFIPLGEFEISEGHGTFVRAVFISLAVFFSAMALAGLFTIQTDPGFTIVGLVGTFQIFYGYNVLKRFYKDTYVVRSRKLGTKWLIRTTSTERGLTFALEVAKANNGFKRLGFTPPDSVSS